MEYFLYIGQVKYPIASSPGSKTSLFPSIIILMMIYRVGGVSRAYDVIRFTTLTKHFPLFNVQFWLRKSIFSPTRHSQKPGNGELNICCKMTSQFVYFVLLVLHKSRVLIRHRPYSPPPPYRSPSTSLATQYLQLCSIQTFRLSYVKQLTLYN